ncbi:MAG: T9SS type A sorting domain-containing protein [Saprospiraceae bacterium]|nr:T9SS type A sorting domain-containing protein [Saprospiraceae bacterium]
MESNIISLSISPNCGGGNTPNCSNIGIAASIGKITVTGLNGAPVSSVQIFNSSWQQLHNCFANCQSPSADFAVPAGSYYVYVKYYTASYTLVCEVNQTVNVAQNLASEQGERFQFDALKHLEHTEIIWLHAGDDNIVEYALERSADGIHFEQLLEQLPDSDAAADFYRNYDLEPLAGDNFYRLQLRYADGSIRYSEVKLVVFEAIIDFTVFPNPANQFAQIDLEPLIGRAANIQIFNSLGVQVENIRLDEVWNKYYQLDLRALHEGQYLICIHSEGKRSRPVKLVIGRF